MPGDVREHQDRWTLVIRGLAYLRAPFIFAARHGAEPPGVSEQCNSIELLQVFLHYQAHSGEIFVFISLLIVRAGMSCYSAEQADFGVWGFVMVSIPASFDSSRNNAAIHSTVFELDTTIHDLLFSALCISSKHTQQ